MRIFESIRLSRPDFFLHSGDHIYADSPITAEVKLDDGSTWKNLVTEPTTKVAETLDEFRGRYRYSLMDENVRRFNAEVPILAQWDDHEVSRIHFTSHWRQSLKSRRLKTMPTAYSYSRFSSVQQSKGVSEDRQDDAAPRWCLEHGYTLDTSNRFRDRAKGGYEGRHLQRGAEFHRFLELVRSGAIPAGSVLIVEHVDHLSRLPWQEGLEFIQQILNNGIDIVTTMDGQRYTKARLAKDMGAIFMLTMYFYRENEQSDTKSLRGKDRWRRARARAVAGEKIGASGRPGSTRTGRSTRSRRRWCGGSTPWRSRARGRNRSRES